MRKFRNFSSRERGVPEDLVKEAVTKYQGMDEDALITELMKMVASQKSSGTFDANQLHSLVDNISGFLTDEQHRKINNILAIIEDEQG